MLTRVLVQTIAPGSRLGFFTCNPRFAERLERIGETSTQSPCGFGQVRSTAAHTCWRGSRCGTRRGPRTRLTDGYAPSVPHRATADHMEVRWVRPMASG